MLSIFADALLIATRQQLLPPAAPRRPVGAQVEKEHESRWFSLMGLKL